MMSLNEHLLSFSSTVDATNEDDGIIYSIRPNGYISSFASSVNSCLPACPRPLVESKDSSLSLAGLASSRASNSPPPPWTHSDCEQMLNDIQTGYVILPNSSGNFRRLSIRSKAENSLRHTLLVLSLGFVCFLLITVYNVIHDVVTVNSDDNKNGAQERKHHRGLLHFQAHSFNDVRQWPSLYRKGARTFKIDPHYVAANHTHLDPFFPVARLLLSHNAPVANVKYDSLDEIIQMLSPSGKLGQMIIADKETLRIQLCFKSAPEPCSSGETHQFDIRDEAEPWINLVDLWFLRLSNKNLKHIEFVLDGWGKPFACLKDRWRPWKSVWIQGDRLSPPKALIIGQDDLDADNKRFAILNNPEGEQAWEKLRAIGYGRFANEPYPYQVWEPDDQASIIKYIELFTSGPNHEPGYTFVSNIDPVMISQFGTVYGSRSDAVIHGKRIGCPLGMVSMKDTSVVVYWNNDKLMYTTGGALKDFSLHTTTLRQWTRFSSSQILSDSNGNFAGLRITRLATGLVWLEEIWEGRLLSSGGGKCLGVQQVTDRRGNEEVVRSLWGLFLGSSGCSLKLEKWRVENSTTLIVEQEICLRLFSASLYSRNDDIQDADFALLPNTNELFVGASDEQHMLYAGFVSVDSESAILYEIGVGSSPRISVSPSTRTSTLKHEQILAVVVTDGFCPNSQLHNKRSSPKVCDAPPVSMTQVISYFISTVSNWHKKLSSPKSMISTCDEDMFFGAMDVGTCPTVALGQVDKYQVQMVSAHKAPDIALAERTCGVSAWHDALVVTLFPIYTKRSWTWAKGWEEELRLLTMI